MNSMDAVSLKNEKDTVLVTRNSTGYSDIVRISKRGNVVRRNVSAQEAGSMVSHLLGRGYTFLNEVKTQELLVAAGY